MRQRQAPAVNYPDMKTSIEAMVDKYFETHCHSQKGYIVKLSQMGTEEFTFEAIKITTVLTIKACSEYKGWDSFIASIVSNKINEHMKQLFAEATDYGVQKQMIV